MVAYRLTPLAEDDLDGIWSYTLLEWSYEQAENYYDDIIDAIEKLAAGERQGRAVSIRDGYQKYIIGKHLVFFRQSDSGIDVIRILHQRMDVDRHL
jgi:toxin ParE1/3/4